MRIWKLAILYTLFVQFSCNHSSREVKTDKSGDSVTPPEIIRIADLPDSLKPKIVVLADMPKPRKILIPRAGGKPVTNTNPDGSAFLTIPSVSKILPAFESRKKDIEKGKIKIPYNSGEGGKLHFSHYTVDDGLANENVTCSMIDRRGDIWLGTYGGGVSRFNSHGFTNFTMENGLAGNSLTDILEDHNGNIWFAASGGLTRYDGNNFVKYLLHNSFLQYIFCITEDRKQRLWMGTKIGLYRYDPEKDSILSIDNASSGMAHNWVTCLCSDQSGNLWIGTSAGLTVYDPETRKVLLSPSDGFKNYIYCIYEDKSGKMWFNDWPRMICYDLPSRRIISEYTVADGLASPVITGITEDNSGNIWFATREGVSCMERDPSGNGYRGIFSLNEMAGKNIYSLLPDSSGNIWMGTWGNGVYRFDFSENGISRSFTTFNSEQGLNMTPSLPVYQEKSGMIWMGLTRFNGTHLTYFSNKNQIWPSEELTCIEEDPSGKIWTGWFNEGIWSYDKNATGVYECFVNYNMNQGLAGNIIWSISRDRKGNLWIGTGLNGASYFDGTRFINYSLGITNFLISEIKEDSTGCIWFATQRGLLCFEPDRDGTFIRFTSAQGLPDNIVRSILIDKSGNLWLGTQLGLCYLGLENIRKIRKYLSESSTRGRSIEFPVLHAGHSGKIFKSFTVDDGLPDNYIMKLAELPGGKIAIGCNSGIAIFSPPTDTTGSFSSLGKVEIFSSVNGFPVKGIYRGQNRMLVDSNGVLWAVTSSNETGMVRFDYASLNRRENPPKVQIRQVRIQEEPVSWHTLTDEIPVREVRDSLNTPPYILDEILSFGRVLGDSTRAVFRRKYEGIRFSGIEKFYPVPLNLKLPYRLNRIVIGYQADELARPQLIEYQYKLEGYDRVWSPVVKTTSATFGNIREGKYTFLVKARYTGSSVNGADEWTEPVTYTFRVHPPWHRSRLAYLVYTFLIVLIVWRIYRFQKERLLRAEHEKAQSRELEHAHEIEKAQAKELEQARKIEKAYHELKTAQNQLIHQEKMASLGEITAGIAHEIQNPLNFVKNFSQLNKELIGELKSGIVSGNTEEIAVLASDISGNEDKIIFHSNRADSIVKSMLQHSRDTSGVKQLTDINNLCDEFFRLAYHGLKAKDKSFNALMQTNFDPTVGKINLMAQDIGRVILNLVSNAFYAVTERAKLNEPGFEPAVRLNTAIREGKIEIRIRDNGIGIPQAILGKIFQPFFTTKPTGEGTGLGLYLAYDIITRGHGGELSVKSHEGQGTEFIIMLPV